MANIYSRMTKINNSSGRSDYINDPKRQEKILLHKEDIQFGWKIISNFEKEKSNADKRNWEAREIVVALPNDLSENLNQLEDVCDDLVKNLIGENHENEYAVHWNKDRTNLHVHILFSERERVQELKTKIYKRDMWYDISTNRMAKANAEGAELRFKKGEIMKDKNGNIRYDSDIFSSKNVVFKSRSFLLEKQYIIQKVLKNYRFNLDIQENNTPYLSQKKLYKNANEDYLNIAKKYNYEVKEYNHAVKAHLGLEPDQRETYQDIRKVLETDIKKENNIEKKLSINAVKVVINIKNYVTDLVVDLKNQAIKKLAKYELGDWWDRNKEELLEIMNDTEEKKLEKNRMENYINSVDKVIDDQEKTIEEVEYNDLEREINYGQFR